MTRLSQFSVTIKFCVNSPKSHSICMGGSNLRDAGSAHG